MSETNHSPETLKRYKNIKGMVICVAMGVVFTIATAMSSLIGIGGGQDMEPDAFMLILDLLIILLRLIMLGLTLICSIILAVLILRLTPDERKGLNNYLLYSE